MFSYFLLTQLLGYVYNFAAEQMNLFFQLIRNRPIVKFS